MKKIFQSVIFLFFAGLMSVNAQVTIGSVKEPGKGALLDLDGKNQGVLFPKVLLTKFDSLDPLISDGLVTSDDKSHSIGMVVYNTNEHADGVPLGFVVWNGKEWQAATNHTVMSKVSAIDCNGIEIKGTYTKNQPLDAIIDKIILPVIVEREGSYNILVEVYKGANHSESNGYTFSASGEFHAVGKTFVTLAGQGTPKEITGDANLDFLKIYLNGEEITCKQGNLPGIKIMDIQPDYTLLCNDIRVLMEEDSRVKGHVMTKDDQISVRVNVPASAVGAVCEIKTNTVNGVWFQGSVTLTKGVQVVTLSGVGVVEDIGSYTYTLTCNNIAGSSCEVAVNIMYDKPIKILVISSGKDLANQMAGEKAATHLIAHNPKLFGLGQNVSSILSVKDIEVVSLVPASIWKIAAADVTVKELSQYAMILIGYDVWFGSDIIGKAFVDNYVQQKGVVYIAHETAGVFLSSAKDNLTNMVNYISNSKITTVETNDGGMDKNLIPLQGTSPAVKGLYADLRLKKISKDGGGQVTFTKYPDDWEMVAGIDKEHVRIIRNINYDIYLCGDGGLLAGGGPSYNLSGNNNPARVDAEGNPLPSNGIDVLHNSGGYNSSLLANLLLYAVQKWIHAHP